jgi:hypothetical protein
LIEYNLVFKSLRVRKGQVVADFIVDHAMAPDAETCVVDQTLWKLFFDE